MIVVRTFRPAFESLRDHFREAHLCLIGSHVCARSQNVITGTQGEKAAVSPPCRSPELSHWFWHTSSISPSKTDVECFVLLPVTRVWYRGGIWVDVNLQLQTEQTHDLLKFAGTYKSRAQTFRVHLLGTLWVSSCVQYRSIHYGIASNYLDFCVISTLGMNGAWICCYSLTDSTICKMVSRHGLEYPEPVRPGKMKWKTKHLPATHIVSASMLLTSSRALS